MEVPVNAAASLWLIVGLAALAAGALGLLLHFRDSRLGRASYGWTQTTGTVVRSRAGRSTDEPGGLIRGRKTRYTYWAAGRQRLSSRFTYGWPVRQPDHSPAREVSRPYAKGEEVTVYYDPGKPSRSVLQQGVPGGGRAVAWLVIALTGCALVAYGLAG
jgi:hypothetical protein